MERDLVNANFELTANMEKRQRQPSGDRVVYLETDLQVGPMYRLCCLMSAMKH